MLACSCRVVSRVKHIGHDTKYSFLTSDSARDCSNDKFSDLNVSLLSQWLATVYDSASASTTIILIALSAVGQISALMVISEMLSHRNYELGFIELATLKYTGNITFIVELHIFGVSCLEFLDLAVGFSVPQKKRFGSSCSPCFEFAKPSCLGRCRSISWKEEFNFLKNATELIPVEL